MKTINLFVVVLVFAVNLFAADPLTERLQRGLFEEEANRNLDAAIKEYQSVVTQSDEQRKVIATALFRLGECYRKLGRTNDANAQYQRILRDYAEQEPLVKLSRELLGAKNVAALPGTTETATSLTQAEAEELARVKTLARNSPDLLQAVRGDNVTELQLASKSGHFSVVEFLLAQGVDPNVAPRELPALIIAARNGHLRIVKLLVEKGADLNVGDGATALWWASNYGYQSVVEFLVEHGADVNRTESSGRGPLAAATEQGRASVVEYLLRHGAKPNVLSTGSVQLGNLGSSRAAEKSEGKGATPLHSAAQRGYRSVAELLLHAGASVAATNYDGMTPLQFAAINGHTNVAALLLEKGAEVDTADAWGFTAFSRAIAMQRPDMMKLLLPYHPNPDRPITAPVYPSCPLTLAVSLYSSAALEVLDILLSARPNLNVTNRDGLTPLMMAVRRNYLPMAEALLRAGVDPDQIVPPWNAPLIETVSNPSVAMAQLLLNNKANPNVLNKSGQTALALAVNWPALLPHERSIMVEREKVAVLLRQHGAKEPPAAATNNPASPSGVPGINAQGYINGVPVPVSPQLPSPARAPGAVILPPTPMIPSPNPGKKP